MCPAPTTTSTTTVVQQTTTTTIGDVTPPEPPQWSVPFVGVWLGDLVYASDSGASCDHLSWPETYALPFTVTHVDEYVVACGTAVDASVDVSPIAIKADCTVAAPAGPVSGALRMRHANHQTLNLIFEVVVPTPDGGTPPGACTVRYGGTAVRQ